MCVCGGGGGVLYLLLDREGPGVRPTNQVILFRRWAIVCTEQQAGHSPCSSPREAHPIERPEIPESLADHCPSSEAHSSQSYPVCVCVCVCVWSCAYMCGGVYLEVSWRYGLVTA